MYLVLQIIYVDVYTYYIFNVLYFTIYNHTGASIKTKSTLISKNYSNECIYNKHICIYYGLSMKCRLCRLGCNVTLPSPDKVYIAHTFLLLCVYYSCLL